MKKLLAILCTVALLTGLLPPSLAAGPAGTERVQFYDEALGRYSNQT